VLAQRLDSLRLLKVKPITLVTYLTLLERHYRSHNSYHNSIHAADVVQSAFALLGHAALQVLSAILIYQFVYLSVCLSATNNE